MSSSSAHNRNPEGKNQYGTVCELLNLPVIISHPHVNPVSADSPVLREALEKYHRELISDNTRISELLLGLT